MNWIINFIDEIFELILSIFKKGDSNMYSDKYDALFLKHCRDFDWKLLKAQAIKESYLDAEAFNFGEGAVGLFQIRSKACQDVSCDYDRLNEPEYNIQVAVEYMELLYNKPAVNRIIKNMLFAYNWGIGNFTNFVNAHGYDYDDMDSDAINYYNKIMEIRGTL